MKHSIVILLLLGFIHGWSQDYTFEPMPWNTAADEYAPVMVEGQLLICSDRRVNLQVAEFDRIGHYPTHWFQASDKGLKQFNLPYRQQFHLGPMAISPDSSQLCFVATMEYGRKEHGVLGLFFSQRLAGGWSTPRAFEHNAKNNEFNITHPTFSPDGRYLYFVSNRKGGRGKSDIYRSERIENGWLEPVNMEQINTNGRDLFPNFAPDGKLYFSSDSIAGSEGFDIFFVTELENGWSFPVKLDAPINSEFNDYSLYMDTKASGYVVSDRQAQGLDVFRFTIGFPEFGPCEESWPAATCYLIEETEFQPVDTLPLRYEWDFGDGTIGKGLSNEHCFPGLGTYEVKLNVYDTIANAHFGTISELLIAIEPSGLPLIDAPDTVGVGAVADLKGNNSELNGFPDKFWFWTVSDGRRFTGKDIQLPLDLEGELTLTVGVSADPTNPDAPKRCSTKKIVVSSEFDPFESNLAQLNKQKVSSTQVANAGIEKDSALYFVEFHESTDRVPLTDDFFARVKYEITERFGNTDSLFHYSIGADEEMINLYGLRKELADSGYVNALVRRENMKEFDVSTIQVGSYYSQAEQVELTNQVQQLADIQFEKDSATLTKESKENLNEIAAILSIESLLILDIAAHTDNTGAEEHNQKLSEDRAAVVVAYLMQNGVEKDRLIAKGFGSRFPKADNETEEGRSLNRRVEFMLRFGKE
ncbi:MAG: hypothetical protein RL226_1472 [Bacteroidota bacterium]